MNSTPLGAVVTTSRIVRDLDRLGLRIGDGRNVSMLRYAAWLVKHRGEVPVVSQASSYDKIRDEALRRRLSASRSGRDIGPIPAIVNPIRREACKNDLRLYALTYFPERFYLPFSPDHLKVISRIEDAVLRGGLFAYAMERGGGKTSIIEVAVLWAQGYGRHHFVALIGAEQEHADEMLDSLKMELENNDRLLEDFPEICYPIRRLEGIAHRCQGQLCMGLRTHVGWTAREIVLPTIPGSLASAGRVKVSGITGRIRGMKYTAPNGDVVRPSLVLIDDPQTDKTARSVSQCKLRTDILSGAILGLAGPDKKISGFMPCTVIAPDDMADRILDHEKHPQWHGERLKMVYQFPKNQGLWDRYAQILDDDHRGGGDGSQATAFYREHREAMDEGSVVSWPERKNPDELSALQHAMNLKFRDEAAFFAEYQNEPLPEHEAGSDLLDADDIAKKLNKLARREVPITANHITAYIDVQKPLMPYCVVAWEDNFTGYVIDYGTWPDQKKNYWKLKGARYTVQREFPQLDLPAQIYAALERVTEEILGREYHRLDGGVMRVDRCLIDANWGDSTEIVYQFCRQSKYAALLMPSHGRFVGSRTTPFAEWKRRSGEKVGHHWRIPKFSGRRAIRYVLIDTNYWKSFVHARFATAMGGAGCVSLFGDNPEYHRVFAEQLTAERPRRQKDITSGREIDEWKLCGAGRDNHLLDCVAGCAVAASMRGCATIGMPSRSAKVAGRRKRRSISFL